MKVLVIGKLQVNIDAVYAMNEDELKVFLLSLSPDEVKAVKKAIKK
jgi:hypothetical protein